LLASCVGCTKSTPEPLFIGHIAPHTLPERAIGQWTDQGVLLAVEEVKDDPPLPGRPVTVLTPETQGSETFPSVATRLVTISRAVALLADVRAASTEQLCRVAQQQSIPLVASSGLPGAALGPFGFSVGLAPAEQGKYLARFAVQELKKKHVVLLVDSRLLLSQPLTAAFADEFHKTEGTQLEQWTFMSDDELTQLVQKLSQSGVDAIVFVGAEGDLAKLRVAAPLPVLFGGEEEVRQPPPVRDAEMYRATAFVIDGSTPRAKEFVAKYQGRFGQVPGAAAALAYDAARVLFEGLRRAKSARGDKVRDELRQLRKFDSLTGPLSFDKDHNTWRPVFIVRQEKEQVQILKRYEPEVKGD
jgi:branched-chain amino acid transport system substrate-binding protein